MGWDEINHYQFSSTSKTPSPSHNLAVKIDKVWGGKLLLVSLFCLQCNKRMQFKLHWTKLTNRIFPKDFHKPCTKRKGKRSDNKWNLNWKSQLKSSRTVASILFSLITSLASYAAPGVQGKKFKFPGRKDSQLSFRRFCNFFSLRPFIFGYTHFFNIFVSTTMGRQKIVIFSSNKNNNKKNERKWNSEKDLTIYKAE